MSRFLAKVHAELRSFALSFPGAVEEFPWGESVAKVKGKVFVFLGKPARPGDEVGFSVKLPHTGVHILDLSYAEPTGYGLGKSGWVTIHLSDRNDIDLPFLKDMIEESYRAVAPKKLVAELGPFGGKEVQTFVIRAKPRAKPAKPRAKAAARAKPAARKPSPRK